MAEGICDLGIIGVGVMGANLALNISDRGFSVAVYDVSAEKTREFVEKEGHEGSIRPAYSPDELAALLRKPRSIIMLVPAGAPVDEVIAGISPHLERGDLLIDGGNSYFIDTDKRSKELSEKGLLYMGMGISGGEYGARNGPSIMPGGPREGFERVRKILEACAARVNGEPCVAYLGAGSAGHYVKMVHNGIEYGLMELIAETYDLMKRGLEMKSESLASVYEKWSQTELNSYLLEITARIFRQKDEKKIGMLLIDMILDHARQKGTGKWTSWDAMDLQVPTPIIDAAVMMRNLSGSLEARKAASEVFRGPLERFEGDAKKFIGRLKNALYASMILTYAQGMALLKRASKAYAFDLDLEAVAGIWRGGCIIRAALLEDVRAACRLKPDLPNLILDTKLGRIVSERESDLRSVVHTAADLGLPVPGFMMALAYFDGCRSVWLPANLVQAQRDYFGAHTYERVDAPGVFHTRWDE